MASDPYKTLGVNRGASQDEIRKAYRELAKKYHPDNFTDVHAKELAEEKMAEINLAYDAISNGNSQQGSSSSSSSYQGWSGNSQGQNPFEQWFQQNQNGSQGRYQNQGNPYKQSPYYRNRGCFSGSCCNDLSCLCCADQCCECMGGDLIPCC